MLRRLTRGIRSRAAGALIIAYALCVVAPAAALAFGDAARAAHCLTHDHHGVATPHSHAGDAPAHGHSAPAHHHAGDAAHDHASAADGNGPPAEQACCGLSCLPAIPTAAIDLSTQATVAAAAPFVQTHLIGHEPDRLSRPPDSSLSF